MSYDTNDIDKYRPDPSKPWRVTWGIGRFCDHATAEEAEAHAALLIAEGHDGTDWPRASVFHAPARWARNEGRDILVTEPVIHNGAAFVALAQQPDNPHALYELRGVRVERVRLTDQEADEPGEENRWNPWRAGQWITRTTYERDDMQGGSILSSRADVDSYWREAVAADERPTDEDLLAVAREEAERIAEEWRADMNTKTERS